MRVTKVKVNEGKELLKKQKQIRCGDQSLPLLTHIDIVSLKLFPCIFRMIKHVVIFNQDIENQVFTIMMTEFDKKIMFKVYLQRNMLNTLIKQMIYKITTIKFY